MDRGNRYEAFIVEEYRHATGRDIERIPFALATHANGWAKCSPDALAGEGLVECKTDLRAGNWAEEDCTILSAEDYTEDLAPAKYVNQCYWQLLVTGAPWVDLVCLLPRYELRIVRIYADDAHQAELLRIVGEWREMHIVRGEAPPIDGSEDCTTHYVKAFPGKGKETRAANAEELAIVGRFIDADAKLKAAELAKETAKNELAARMENTYGLTTLAGKFLYYPMTGRTTVSTSALREKYPDIADEFCKTSEPTRVARYYPSTPK
jgi:predicted phage-related endonuclease